MNTRKLTTLAMLIAINVILSIITPVKVANFKFTFEAFPILVAAFLFGPIEGLIVGVSGPLLYQVFFSGYGITPTTLLWVLPHALSGLLAGSLARLRKSGPSYPDTVAICIISAFTVTCFNILALYVDSKLYGYYSKTLVFGNIILKVITGILLAFVYSSILPKLLAFLKRKIES